ncbi:MAG: alpha/beta fold hydrolase [Candidatus Marinimicrobia bacterium]|nr:alpha/beta fold hydrolase [Candidatus Neomarinimicrobiota bacterium]
MIIYVLIHGAWHGSWCWDKVVPLLEKEGHKVEAPDLPGHGRDKTPIPEISLKAYADRVCQILDTQSEPVILVGHSMGGVVITQTAEYRPEKIKTLVYLTAFLLRNGEFLLQLAEGDTEALVLPNLIMAEDQSYATVRDEAIKETFYGDCSDEDVARAKSLLVPQAVAPFATPVNTTEEKFGRVPRVYISCLRDKAITPALQEKMYKVLPCEKVISMDTSHSPFFSAPEELVGHLLLL